MTIARVALLAIAATLTIGEMSFAGGIPQSPAIEALIPEIQGKQPERWSANCQRFVRLPATWLRPESTRMSMAAR